MVALVASESPDCLITELLPATASSQPTAPDRQGSSVPILDPHRPIVKALREDRRPSCLDPLERESALKQALTTSRLENIQLKELVVRLSETIMKRVVGDLQSEAGKNQRYKRIQPGA
jgi:hypothetical protein